MTVRMRTFLRRLQKFGKRVAEFQVRLILTVVYFIFLLPYALLQWLTRRPPVSRAEQSYWISTLGPAASPDIAALRRQF